MLSDTRRNLKEGRGQRSADRFWELYIPTLFKSARLLIRMEGERELNLA